MDGPAAAWKERRGLIRAPRPIQAATRHASSFFPIDGASASHAHGGAAWSGPGGGGSRGVTALLRSFFAGDVVSVARGLIGATLLVDGVGGRIVETEAYDAQDPASHSFAGMTPRNAAMFDRVGHAYVYRSYGLHWCFNIVCSAERPGSAVLIRALEPVAGRDVMAARRGAVSERALCGGPGRLAQALAIDARLNGAPLDQPPFDLLARDAEVAIVAGPRVGITKAATTPWRFCLAGSRYLSKPARG